jgi:hypothetical protein
MTEEAIDSIQSEANERSAEVEKQLLSIQVPDALNESSSNVGQDFAKRLDALEEHVNAHIKALSDTTSFGQIAEDVSLEDPQHSRIVSKLTVLGKVTTELDTEFNEVLKLCVNTEDTDPSLSARLLEMEKLVMTMNSKFEELPVSKENLAEALKPADFGSNTYFATNVPAELLVLRVTVENFQNGTPVARPSEVDQDVGDWTLNYAINEEEDQEAALLAYKALQKKTLAAQWSEQRQEVFYRSALMKRLFRFSEEGRSWRDKQDEIDSQKEKVVFHPHES